MKNVAYKKHPKDAFGETKLNKEISEEISQPFTVVDYRLETKGSEITQKSLEKNSEPPSIPLINKTCKISEIQEKNSRKSEA